MRRPGVKSTKHVSRDVNPMFKSTIVLEDIEEEMSEFVVRDVGVCAQAHIGGFGPRVVASARMRAGEDFNGYLELNPAKEIPEQGPPVLQVSTRHSLLMPFGMPPLGNTSVLTQMFGSFQGDLGDRGGAGPLAGQALTPSAPWPSTEPAGGPGAIAEELGSSGVSAAPTTSPALATSPAPAATTGSSGVWGVPAECTASSTHSRSGSGGVSGGFSGTSWIDPEVAQFCPKGQRMSRLMQMQDRQLV